MTFRSLITLLGGTPADTLDTPAEPVGTRFVGFGEALSSAIANRPHYALAENTDDLNARLVIWETTGLDAAYDLGLTAIPGGGRVITKDAGAVETQSALATTYADDPANAHFRASMLSDVISGSVGFDAPRFRAIGPGFMERFRLNEAGDTVWAPGQAATVNVGGGSGDVVTIGGGGQFSDGVGSTELLRGDLVEVIGGTDPGLYRLEAITAGTTATLRGLDGSVPTFAANEGVTITGYRAKFLSSALIDSDFGTVVRGVNGAAAAMTLVGGRSGNPASGADYALDFRGTDADGVLAAPFSHFSGHGTWKYTGVHSGIPSASLLNFESAAIDIDRDGTGVNGTFGLVSRPANTQYADYSLLSLEQVFDLGTVVRAFDFLAGADEIQITGIVGSEDYLGRVGTVIEIVTPTAQAGFYRVGVKTGVDSYRLADFGGGFALGLPGAGAGTCRMYQMNSVGRGLVWSLGDFRADLSVPSVNNDVRTGALFAAEAGDGGSSLVLVSAEDGAGGNNKYFIRGIAAKAISGLEADAETFQVDADGNMELMGSIYAGLGATIENANININDAPILLSHITDTVARLQQTANPPTGSALLLMEFRVASSGISFIPIFCRIYVGDFGFAGVSSETFYISWNARWTGTNWAYDSDEEAASLMGIGQTFFGYNRIASLATPWTSATFATRSFTLGASGSSSNYSTRIAYAGVAWHQNVASGQVIEAGCTWPASFTGGAPTSTATTVIAEGGTTGAANIGNITAYGAVASKATTAVIGIKRYIVELDASP